MPVMFSTLPKTNFNFSLPFILSSANAFNLDQSKILSFGKELNNFIFAMLWQKNTWGGIHQPLSRIFFAFFSKNYKFE